MTIRIDRIESRPYWLAANAPVWLFVVFLYSQSIEVWHVLVANFGRAIAGGVPIALAVFLVVLVAVRGRRYFIELSRPWVVASAAIFIAGLLATDPAFPAKRVHVPEYFALTLLIFWSCRPHMPRLHAVWGAVVLAIALGGVDEILQGAMATRTFGLRDVGTNAIGALSAGLYLQSFSNGGARQRAGRVTLLYAAILLLAIGLLLVGANAHKGAELPVWIYLPALAVLPLSMIDRAAPGARFLEALSALCAVALVLLGGIDALDIDFR